MQSFELLTSRRRSLVEAAPVIDHLFDSMIEAIDGGLSPELRGQIRRIAREQARPLAEYRTALRLITKILREAEPRDERVEDIACDVVFEAVAAASIADEVQELHDERELRGRVVSALAHDIRTPLSAIRVGSEVLPRTQDLGRIQQIASRIKRNVDRVEDMLRDLLDANAIRGGGKPTIERGRCNLVKVVQDTIDDLTTIHGNRFVLRASSVAIEGMWDGSAVRRIIENLCGNAVKYGHLGTPITVSLVASDAGVQIEVHNEGDPIDDEVLRHLFVPFFRADTARKQTGWGVGLSIVKGLAEAHGGSVALTSSPDSGTTVRVLLPR